MRGSIADFQTERKPMSHSPRIAALIVAAGSGSRAGGGMPKQYRILGGKPLLAHSVNALAECKNINILQIVIGAGQEDLYAAAVVPSPAREGRAEERSAHASTPFIHGAAEKLRPAITGGAQRQDSVRAGLEALAEYAPDYVLIHDAARPFLSARVIDRLLGALSLECGVAPALPVSDTVRRHTHGRWEEIPRDGLLRMQTPQAFPFAPLHALHHAAAGRMFTDDAALWLEAGRRLLYVEGEECLRKVTTAEDIAWAEARCACLPRIAVGSGFDVHRFTAGDGVMLGGVRIPHSHALEGHSDADVVLHALVDALLGALGEGDIGSHFPPGDARWKGADSAIFVTEAVARVKRRGGAIQHADVTVIGERPKIGPHRAVIRARLAGLLGVPPDYVSIKATTTERLGFTGRGEGLAAQATITLALPMEDL